jgi:hypothetical protein
MTETLLMAVRGEDAEPVLVAVTASEARLTLDDGETLVFDRVELAAALTAHRTRSTMGEAA